MPRRQAVRPWFGSRGLARYVLATIGALYAHNTAVLLPLIANIAALGWWLAGPPPPSHRLGWEANGDWYPWTAVGKPAAQWRDCFTRVAKAMKAAAPNLRISWHMAKEGRIDARTIWPDGAPITNVSLSHYDDGSDRFGHETHMGGPWGPRAWPSFARSKGRKLAIGEWGVGRASDNPRYIQEIYDFPGRGRERHRARIVLQHRAVPDLPRGPEPQIKRALPAAVLSQAPGMRQNDHGEVCRGPALPPRGVRELWLTTSNDNLDALRFYQRRGF